MVVIASVSQLYEAIYLDLRKWTIITMKRITPRTCLWPLTGSLIASFALSLGLTFRSDHHCYAGTCGEWLFPLQTRLHVIVWYCWLSLSVTILALRAFHPSIRRGLHNQLYTNQLPIVRKSLTISGVLIILWVLSLYGIIIGIWWLRLRGYFVARGEQGGIMNGNRRMAAIALTGQCVSYFLSPARKVLADWRTPIASVMSPWEWSCFRSLGT